MSDLLYFYFVYLLVFCPFLFVGVYTLYKGIEGLYKLKNSVRKDNKK